MKRPADKELKKLRKNSCFYIRTNNNQYNFKYEKFFENYKVNVISQLENILVNSEAFERFVVLESLTGVIKFGNESLDHQTLSEHEQR